MVNIVLDERGFQKAHSGKHVLSTGADTVVTLKSFTVRLAEGRAWT